MRGWGQNRGERSQHFIIGLGTSLLSHSCWKQVRVHLPEMKRVAMSGHAPWLFQTSHLKRWNEEVTLERYLHIFIFKNGKESLVDSSPVSIWLFKREKAGTERDLLEMMSQHNIYDKREEYNLPEQVRNLRPALFVLTALQSDKRRQVKNN